MATAEQRRQWNRKYYETGGSDKIKAHRDKRRAEIKDIIAAAKDCPCTDCGVKYPPFVMQFDHIGTDKEFTIATATKRLFGNERLLAEIAKCEVVCANCHSARTHHRRSE